jgi:signal transduction histidine kinase
MELMKILVIEDERYLLEDIVEMLQYTNYDVFGAHNGVQGLKVALEQQPDLIVCDIMMPEMNGYDVLQRVRANPDTASVPFVFLTAKADRDSMRQGMELGADDYLTKPFTSSELLTAISARLKRHSDIVERSEHHLEYVKQQLARMVTHELRTPLISINTVLNIISRQIGQLTTSEMQELIDTIDAGSKRLSHRVEQMVYLTQLETGMLTREVIAEKGMPLELWDLLVSATNIARRFAYQQGDSINVNLHSDDRGGMVLCNPSALKQALAELIANALTFSPANGQVEIAQWVKDGSIWVSVVDQGPGIPASQLEAALEAFQQLDRESQEQQGIGIGLTLAHRIIDAHGGIFDLRSVVGKGTQVVVGLPLYAN